MSYKIVKLTIENFKRIKYAEIIPTDNIVVIGGKNGQGKTSVLDSFVSALCGVDTNFLPMPIREGAAYAKNTVDIGDYVITRKWTSSDKTYIQIKTKEGKKVDPPQQFLNKQIGKLSFDPLEFCNYDPKKQVEVLLNLIGLKEPLQKIDEEKKKTYEERTDINREINRLEAQIKMLPVPEKHLPGTKIDTQDLIIELNQANGIIRENQNVRNELMNVEATIDNAEKEVFRIKKRMADLESQLIIYQGKRDILRNKITQDPDVNEITDKIARSNEINNKIDKIEEYKIKKTEYNGKLTASEYCTERLKELENEKVNLLKGVHFPVDGLGFTEEGVLFNNVPFIQCSSSEKLKVSIPVAMALNPELRVVRIMNGNLLDKDSKQYIKKIAKEQDFQVWVEEVCNEKGTVEFYVEDGELK